MVRISSEIPNDFLKNTARLLERKGKTDYRHSAAAAVVAFYNILPILTTISTLSTP